MEFFGGQRVCPATGENYSIYRWQFVLLKSKAFSGDALEAVAIHRLFDVLFSDYQTEPGLTLCAIPSEHQNAAMSCAIRSIIKDGREILCGQ